MRKNVGAAKLIRESVVEQVKSDDGSVVLEYIKLDGYPWFFDASNAVLYSRVPHSENIYNKIKSSYDYHVLQSRNPLSYDKDASRCLIIGQPDIGKTVSLNVYIRKAVIDGIDVIVETRSNRYFISKDSDDILEASLSNEVLLAYRERPDVLTFHDCHSNTEPLLLENQGYVVAAVSPDASNFHEFIKHNTLEIWIPLPTLAEILAMNSLLPPPLSDEIITNRVATVGPLVRYVLNKESHFDGHVKKMENAASEFELTKSVSSFLSKGYVSKNRDELSWKLFLIDGKEDYTAPSGAKWVSNYMKDKALMSSRLLNLKDVEKYLLTTLGNPTVIEQPSSFYEYWVFRKLASGSIILQPQSCVTGEPTGEIGAPTILTVEDSLTMPLTNRVITIEDLKQHPSILFYPLIRNYPYVDAVALIEKEVGKFELLLFQATIGLNHNDIPLDEESNEDNKITKKAKRNEDNDITTTLVMKAKNHADIVSIRCIFIVPYFNKFALSSKQSNIRPDNVSVEIAELRPRSLCW